MSTRTTVRMPIAAAAALLAVASACREDRDYPEPVTEIDVVEARRETAREGGVDPYVVGPAMTPKVEGRIIYEPPPSLAEVSGADTLVRRANTGTTDSPSASPPSDASGRGGASRDTAGSTPSRPERR